MPQSKTLSILEAVIYTVLACYLVPVWFASLVEPYLQPEFVYPAIVGAMLVGAVLVRLTFEWLRVRQRPHFTMPAAAQAYDTARKLKEMAEGVR